MTRLASRTCRALGALALALVALGCGEDSDAEPRTVADDSGDRGGAGGAAATSPVGADDAPQGGANVGSGGAGTAEGVETTEGGSANGGAPVAPTNAGGAGGSMGGAVNGGAMSGGGMNGGAPQGNGGSAGDAVGGAAGDPTVDQMIAVLNETVSTYCTAAETCCSEAGVPAELDDCEATYAMVQPAVPAIVDGAVTLDLAALERCQAAYEGPDQCNLNAVVAACADVFVGLQQEDEVCHGLYDCDRSRGATTCLISDSNDGVLTGVCKAVPRGVAGGPCLSTCQLGYDCSSTTQGATEAGTLCFEEDGLFCEYTEAGSVCSALVAIGETCTGFDQCGSLARCDETCQPLAALGEPCGQGCERRLQCGDDGTCVDPTWATEYGCSGHPPVP